MAGGGGVVPYIGTWIETELVEELNAINLVVPYIGTWIETRQRYSGHPSCYRRTLYRYVD